MEATILNLYDTISGHFTSERKLFLVFFLTVCLRKLHITLLSYFKLINRKYLQVCSTLFLFTKEDYSQIACYKIHPAWSVWHTLKLTKYYIPCLMFPRPCSALWFCGSSGDTNCISFQFRQKEKHMQISREATSLFRLYGGLQDGGFPVLEIPEPMWNGYMKTYEWYMAWVRNKLC